MLIESPFNGRQRPTDVPARLSPVVCGCHRQEAHESAICPKLTGVDPRGTSRTCPAWGEDDRRNRAGEMFRCIVGDHKGDADFIGARNVSTKTRAALGRVYGPRSKKCL